MPRKKTTSTKKTSSRTKKATEPKALKVDETEVTEEINVNPVYFVHPEWDAAKPTQGENNEWGLFAYKIIDDVVLSAYDSSIQAVESRGEWSAYSDNPDEVPTFFEQFQINWKGYLEYVANTGLDPLGFFAVFKSNKKQWEINLEVRWARIIMVSVRDLEKQETHIASAKPPKLHEILSQWYQDGPYLYHKDVRGRDWNMAQQVIPGAWQFSNGNQKASVVVTTDDNADFLKEEAKKQLAQ